MFGAEGDLVSTVVWFIFFIFFMLFGSRMMVTQTVLKLEKDVAEFEDISKKSKEIVLNYISKKPTPKIKESVKSFMDFFAVTPISTDPYGVMKKLDHVIKQADNRFDYFVNQIAPDFSKYNKRNLKCSLEGAMTTHQIAKIMRHMLELIKKHKMLQLAMILQMQVPLIKSMAKSAMHATKAFADGIMIGDSIGPLVVANMMKGKVKLYDEEEFVYIETKIDGKNVIISKADGPGATVAKPGKFLKKIIKKKKITRIISVDAGMRFEGDKSGEVIEGVGIAMGPGGTDRFEMEDITVQKNIPLDAIVIKVSEEEALMPMKKEIVNSVSRAIGVVRENIRRGPKNERILIMGVGNTCGVGNTPKDALEAEKALKIYLRKMPQEKKKRFK